MHIIHCYSTFKSTIAAEAIAILHLRKIYRMKLFPKKYQPAVSFFDTVING